MPKTSVLLGLGPTAKTSHWASLPGVDVVSGRSGSAREVGLSCLQWCSHLPDHLPKIERSLHDSDLGGDLVPGSLATGVPVTEIREVLEPFGHDEVCG